MAIVVQSGSASSIVASSSTTFSKTVTAGNNLMLIVGVGCQSSDSDFPISSVTYNSVAMTQVPGSQTKARWNENKYHALYYLINPSTGANNVVVSSDAVYLFVVASSFENVKQYMFGVEASYAYNLSYTPSLTRTTQYDGSLLIDIAPWLGGWSAGGGLSANGGQTLLASAKQNGPAYGAIGMSYKSVPTAGSTTMGWTFTGLGSANWQAYGILELIDVDAPITEAGTYTGDATFDVYIPPAQQVIIIT